jgi:hypothetical protein
MLRRKVPIDDRTSEETTTAFDESRLHGHISLGTCNKRRAKHCLPLASLASRLPVAVRGRGYFFRLILLIVIVILFVNEGHHLTCRLHGALCTPFREYVNRFPMLPSRRKDHSSLFTVKPPISLSCKRFEDFVKKHHHAPLRILLLVGESRGGSTYTYDTLNFHPEITMIGQEALFSFSNNVCNNNELLLRDHENCTFANWLEALYRNAYDRAAASKQLVGTKVNIEQIPPEFYEDLASYLSCIRESAHILHVTRASAIASFLNYQAEPIERIHDANFNIDSNKLANGLETPLELDAELAANWVHTRDGLSQDLFRTLGFNAPLPLRYQRVYYEHLKDPTIGDDYWRSVFAFLGVNASIPASTLRAQSIVNTNRNLRTHTKTHGSTPCSQRIANWEEVKQALGPESLSSTVCESHS